MPRPVATLRNCQPRCRARCGAVAVDYRNDGFARAPYVAARVVHYLLLSRPTRAEPLAAFYPNLTDTPLPPAAVYPAFRAFVDRARGELAPLLAERVTQTNEVGRCTYLLPAYVVAAHRCRTPLWIIDVGASAGLNLQFDRYAYEYGNGVFAGDLSSAVKLRTEQRRGPVPTIPMPEIAGRAGVDLAPIDLDDPAATRWLEACVWPEHVERFSNLRAALDVARIARPRVSKGNAVDAAAGAGRGSGSRRDGRHREYERDALFLCGRARAIRDACSPNSLRRAKYSGLRTSFARSSPASVSKRRSRMTMRVFRW